jgi:hypothetical protein
MAVAFYEIPNTTRLKEVDALTIPRARKLAAAILRQRAFTLVELHRHDPSGSEILVIDVETDAVPPNNQAGIKFRERLALYVPQSPKKLVEARTLRKDFPVLAHENATAPGDPLSLCLYFEPVASVLRTWTPPSFFRRIQWWLEKSAKGELHPADQPVEQLFFATPLELVLPWNFVEQRKNASHRFVLGQSVKRPDGMTFFAQAATGALQSPSTALFEISLSPIVHGVVEREPDTLGELADTLAKRGAELFTPLKESLAQRITDQGEMADATQKTVFLVYLPICRKEGEAPERIACRAFHVNAGPLSLGEMIGALIQHQGRYFRNFDLKGGSPPESDQWRALTVAPLEVLLENDAAAARRQSGIKDHGPEGVLIGVGSLGSAILNIWDRCGWGRWTVIDKDHIKPHNLSRHTALLKDLGAPKADVVAQLHSMSRRDGTVTPLVADATELQNPVVCEALRKAALVVDASTTLEYPRAVSGEDGVARHLSVFLTPSGSAAVLLAEDNDRLVRLRCLEAQYYRAVIQEDWGQKHLEGNAGTFWSGAGCRDISVVMPYSQIMAHASLLAEQIPLAQGRSSASVRIWERSAQEGSMVARQLALHPEQRMKFGEFDLFLDEGVEHELRQFRTAKLPCETGGVLLGYYDFNINAVVIVCGLPSPPDSKESPDFFERGVSGLAQAVNEATRRTAGVVGYVGEWHSHPPGHGSSQSGADIVQLCHLAFGMSEDGLPALQLIVGEQDIQIYHARAILVT